MTKTLIVAALVGVVVACRPPASQDPGDRDPTWLAELAQACALRASCAHGHDSSEAREPTKCVAAWLAGRDSGQMSARQTCMMQAKTCEAAHACEATGAPEAVAYCRAHVGQATACDGNARVECGDDADEAERVDCATLKGSCQIVKHSGGLTESACVSPSLCPAGANEGRCESEGVVLACQDGAAERIVCKSGQKCVARKDDDGAQRASCETLGAPRCSSPGARYCEGERLVACSGPRGNEKSAVEVSDCGALGLRCEGDGKTAGCYVRGKPDCAVEDAATCEGGGMTYCAFGRKVRVACASIGGSACEAGAHVACHLGPPPR